jgi:hypothetical protein
MPIDYKNGKIYKIVSEQTEKVYIGSTCQTLSQRLADHKRHFKQYNNGKTDYVTSYEIVKYDDCQIVLIELFPCVQKCELHAREYHHMKLEINKVNIKMPTKPNKEWREDNKEKLKEKHAEYVKANKEHLDMKRKEWTLLNKTKQDEYHKQYRETNHEKILTWHKDFYQNNKEVLNNKRKNDKYTCVCGTFLRNDSMKMHETSQKHINFLNK